MNRLSRRFVWMVTPTLIGLPLLLIGCGEETTPPQATAESTLETETEKVASSTTTNTPPSVDVKTPGEQALERYQKRIALLPQDDVVLDDEGRARVARIGSIQMSEDARVLETLNGVKPDLHVTLTNQDHEEVNLSDLIGKTIVLTSIFTSCPQPEMCPRLTADIAWLSRQVPDELDDDIHFILISLDPRVDTPEVMKAFGTARGLTFDHTDMLTGDPDVISTLLDDELMIPISYDEASGRIATHATMIHVINPDGFVVVERVEKSRDAAEQVAEEMVRAATRRFIPPEG